MLGKGRFARSVVAEHRYQVALADGQAHMVECKPGIPGVAEYQILCADNRIHFQHSFVLWYTPPSAGLRRWHPENALCADYRSQIAVEPCGRTSPFAVTGSPISEEEVFPPLAPAVTARRYSITEAESPVV